MIKVIVIDDDFMVAKIHAGFVARAGGFEVVAIAHTGAEALRETMRLRPDLILLDIHLPDINGVELLKRLRAAVPDLDVLVISAARDVDTVRSALRGGLIHYLIKPFAHDELSERLAHYRDTYGRFDSSTNEADQTEVDKLFEVRRAERALAKGLSTETLHLVERALSSTADDLSATEVSAVLGTSRSSARRYLEYLADNGRAEVRLRYGVGRPERRYAWIRASN